MARALITHTVKVDNVTDVLAEHPNTLQTEMEKVWNTFAFVGATEKTIDAAGAVVVTSNYHTIDTFGDAASDNLDTITISGDIEEGSLLFIRPDNDARTVVVRHGIDNILCPGGLDITLDDVEKCLMLIYDETLVAWMVVRAVDPAAITISPQFALTAAGGRPTTTSGCAVATQLELATNDVDLVSLDFDPDADEYAVWQFPLPSDYDGGTITFKVLWSHPAATAFVVYYELTALCLTDGDAQDAAWGAAVSVNDTGGTTNDLYITAASAAVTIGGTPAAGNYCFFRLMRDADNGSDTLDADARVQAVQITYTRT